MPDRCKRLPLRQSGVDCCWRRRPLESECYIAKETSRVVELAQPPHSASDRPAATAILANLLVATARGDRQSFADLYQLTHRRLYAVALALLRQQDAAEDAVQEAYLAIWRTAGQYQPDRAPALVWLMAIVRHRAIEVLRQQRRRAAEMWAESLDEDALQIPDPHQPLFADPVAHAIQECLRHLSADQAQAITLAFFHGLSHEELATRLETPLGTVKSWVRRGLLQLKGCLES
jgi:RNA polymerase sigma-70 factor, ECF subfamily